MAMARRLNQSDNILHRDSAERAFNKLARTFTTQMEALKRYRTGGQQRVVVEHVTVRAGHRRHRRGGGWGGEQKRGTTPCKGPIPIYSPCI